MHSFPIIFVYAGCFMPLMSGTYGVSGPIGRLADSWNLASIDIIEDMFW